MTDLLTITPREFDTRLAKLHKDLAVAQRTSARHMKNLSYYFDGYGHPVSEMTREELARRVQREIDHPDCSYLRGTKIASALRTIEDMAEMSERLQTQIAAYNRAFTSRGGWTRFYLVNTADGHIHAWTYCSTCRESTEFTWLPEVSGKDETAAVAEYGARLCTVCFPSAPVEFINYWDKDVQAAREGTCAGSGTTDWVEGSTRFGYAAGNGGTCSHCDEWVAATSLRKVRKHKG